MAGIVKKDPRSAEEQNDTTSVCELSLNNIFAQLHDKAIEEAKKAVGNYQIINSAVEGDGPKAKFMGAGQHIVMATPTSEDLVKEDALKALQTYIQWFSGPDCAEKVTLDTLVPLTQPVSKEDKDAEYKKRRDDIDTANAKAKESVQLSPLTAVLFEHKILCETSQKEDEEIAKDAGEKITGYYITFTTEIGDQKASGLDTAWQRLKKFAKDQLGEITFTTTSLFSGGGKTLNVGDLMNKMDYKTIDASKLPSSVQKQFSTKYPTLNPSISVIDTSSLINYLKGKLDSTGKALLKPIKYALCIKINKKDKGYELFNKQEIADLVSDGIQKTGLGRIKNPNKVTKNEVILVNNYDDYKKDKADNQFKKDTAVKSGAIPKESMESLVDIMRLVLEDVDYIYEALSEEQEQRLKDIAYYFNDKDKSGKLLDAFMADDSFTDTEVKNCGSKVFTNKKAVDDGLRNAEPKVIKTKLRSGKLIDKLYTAFRKYEKELGSSAKKDEAVDKTKLIDEIKQLVQDINSAKIPLPKELKDKVEDLTELDSKKADELKSIKKQLTAAKDNETNRAALVDEIADKAKGLKLGKSPEDLKLKDQLKKASLKALSYDELKAKSAEVDSKLQDKDYSEQSADETTEDLRKEVLAQVKKLQKASNLKEISDNTKDADVRQAVKDISDTKFADKVKDAKKYGKEELDALKARLDKVQQELNKGKLDAKEKARVKPTALRVKFNFIKYHLQELIDKGYLKLKFVPKFDLPTNQNEIEEIEKIKWDDTKGIAAKVKLSDDELAQFVGMSDAELKQVRQDCSKSVDGSPTQKAIQRLHDDLFRIANEIYKKDRKAIEKLIPGVNGLDDLKQQLGDPKNNNWNLGPGQLLRKIKNMQDWLKTGAQNKEDAVDSKRTDWDCYIVALKNLKFKDAKADTHPDKDSN